MGEAQLRYSSIDVSPAVRTTLHKCAKELDANYSFILESHTSDWTFINLSS